MLIIRQQIASYKSTLYSRQAWKTGEQAVSQSNDGAIKSCTETFNKQSYDFNTFRLHTVFNNKLKIYNCYV